MSTKKPAVKTTTKKAAPKKPASPRTEPTTSSRSASRSKAPAKKPTVTIKGAKTLRSSCKKPNETNVSKQPAVTVETCGQASQVLRSVSSVEQISRQYGEMTKSDARRLRKQFYAAGRRDLAAAPRS